MLTIRAAGVGGVVMHDVTPEAFRSKVTEFGAFVQKLITDSVAGSSISPDRVELQWGTKWCKVVRHRAGSTSQLGSTYGFVALCDFSNKTLGQVWAGDIHKTASADAPARTARGNIFDHKITCCNAYSIAYLR